MAIVVLLPVLPILRTYFQDGDPQGAHVMAASTGEVKPPSGGEGGAAPFVFDPAHKLLDRIIERDFRLRSDVVMKRLLPDFDDLASKVEKIDVRRMRALRRGAGWVQLDAPLRSGDERPGSGPEEGDAVVQLRLVLHENLWKLDRLRVFEGRKGQ